ncbi:winged helix DNA-binding domain-containing protein [Dyadobacter aurulentus]|uniref:winged helix DNA-binding domain-containing protein n=1 Tax=Dyadobacter sp. UC 10 TaxID=2605428 RepID=UPI0011F1C511|nr:winged helix DNA-binding domain-containing protein [Dyadobacter sp. UC 10]KAA0990921.1 winged helix DNA-binding domain-containing protein [Dyadobacter sp. UC 10]
MNRREIIQQRLFNQGLSANRFENPDEVVAHFGAVQAQDFSMALWALGLRIINPGRSAIENLINSGEIIRTHVLRPTWHLVHQKDIRWMLELSAPHVKRATQYVDKKEGLTDELFLKAWKLIERKFGEVDDLTKEDIMICLAQGNTTVGNLLAAQIIIRAELEMLLCNGAKKGTYALFEKRVPRTGQISRSEAITKLAQLYFKSRGPATLKDFAWWSGLSMTDSKFGIAELGKQLIHFKLSNLEYYHFEMKDSIPQKTTFALLPCYDEYTVGYSEGRDIALPSDFDNSKIGNGIFKPIILSQNEIVGTWRKSKEKPFVETHTFSDSTESMELNINKYVEKVCKFYG